MRKSLMAAAVLLLAQSLGGCGYNTLQVNDEQIKSSWSEVVNQYQRRADLIPNLVNTVKGFAAQEKEVLLGVTNDDPTKSAVLLDPSANSYLPVAWEGAGPGVHHREGVLRFKPIVPRPASVELRIQRADETTPHAFRWPLQ